MPKFSRRSLKELHTCDNRLRMVFKIVVKNFDCTILKGYRGEKEQNEKFYMGLSKIKYPHSSHNSRPSHAVDVAPYPINWRDRERFNYFAGYVKGVAAEHGIRIKWGGDWDNDTEVRDNDFDDLPHFELIDR